MQNYRIYSRATGLLLADIVAADEVEARSCLVAWINGFKMREQSDDFQGVRSQFVEWVHPEIQKVKPDAREWNVVQVEAFELAERNTERLL
jgi:hypothetical protein